MAAKHGITIAPSILRADFGRLAEQVREAEAAGADAIHIDVMDGHFVPPITIGPMVVEAVRRATTLPLDVHLMIERPDLLIEAFRTAGASNLTIHVEATPHPHRVLQEIRAAGLSAGIGLNPGTPVSAIEELLSGVDTVLVMSVNPGWGGQPFIPSTVEKMRRIRELLDEGGLAAVLEVDGGVSRETAGACVTAGARMLVAGNAVYGAPAGVGAGMAQIRAAIAAAMGRA